LASRVLNEFKQKIKNLTLVPAGGGCFEVSANGELLYSKLKTGQFPDEQNIIDQLEKRLAKK
jgi:selenoprotein W-related protein